MAFSEDSDETASLLRKVEEGDAEALEDLLRLHRPYLKRVVQMRLDGDMAARVDASDVVQEAQTVIARRISDFIERRPSSFRVWIRREAVEQMIDQRRRHVGADKRSTRKEPRMSDVASVAIARQLLSNSPSRNLRKQELWDQVLALVEKLGESDREIMGLRHVEGLSNNEVGDLLNMSPNTVRQRYGRALRRLHKLLAEEGISMDEAVE